MAQARLKTWVAAEVLYAADLNNEFGNILNNALAVISPLTGSLDAGGFDITALDELAFSDAAAGASVAGRLRRNGTSLEYHDGTASRVIYKASGTDVAVADGGTGLSSGTSGGVPYFSGTTTIASSGALTANGVVYGGGAGAAPSATAQGGTNTVLTASAGAPSFSAAPVVNTSVQIGVASTATGSLILAHASSASLTTIQAGNATEANTYVWPTDGGAANQVLTTDGATPTTTLSWTTVSSTSAASQAEQETGSATNVYVSPGRQQFHASAAKSWGQHNAAGTIAASYNVSSVTDTGVGVHTVNFTTAMSGTAYGVVVSASETNVYVSADTLAAGSFRYKANDADTPFGVNDPDGWHHVAFGDQ